MTSLVRGGNVPTDMSVWERLHRGTRSSMSSLPTGYLLSLRKRAINERLFARRRRAASIVVDNVSYPTRMRECPAVGITLDVGFPVVVTSSRRVAGGGILVTARRADLSGSTRRRLSG